MPPYGYQRHLSSSSMDIYSAQQQQQQPQQQQQQQQHISYQSPQIMQPQMAPPYLMQQMMPPQSMNLQHPSYNSQGGIVTPQQLQQQQMASMQHQQQSQGMTQHGHIQGLFMNITFYNSRLVIALFLCYNYYISVLFF